MDIELLLKTLTECTGIRRNNNCRLDSVDAGVRTFKLIADAMLEWRGGKYDDSGTLHVIRHLVEWAYMLNPTTDPTKGFLIKGKTGRGKTFLLDVFSELLRIDGLTFTQGGKERKLQLTKASVHDLCVEYSDKSADTAGFVRKYANIPCLFLDDIGAEQRVSHNFGNRVNVVELIIEQRERRGMITFGTSNLPSLSEAGYDDRTVSRMKSLFNVEVLNHREDYRWNK